ncbi:MAG: SPOR domain-containing protein, partial [Nitratireductor sp.]
IYALITKSANDVAAAVGEHIGGTESQFGVLMTKKARSIGMSKTVFKNASGLPNRKQVTTARDMATLGIALREHYPQYFKYFSARSFKFGKRTYNSYNRLLGRVRGVDGIKTGYTRASGYNLVSSVYDRKRSIVAVVLGGKSGKSRNAQMTNLINRYLKNASTGRDRIVVAKGNPNKARSKSVFASIFKKPKKPSIPIARPTSPVIASSSMVTAYAAEPDNGPDLLQDNLIGQEIAALPTSQIPVPNVSPIARPDMVVTASTNVKGSTAAKASAQQPAKGWQIQIGAVPSKQDATNRLNAARKYQSKTLAKVENYTMMVETNGGTLYRARFAGFASKKQAWAACNKLKKKYDCLALAN